MLNWLLHRQIAAFEKAFDYDMGYAHEMLETSRPAFWRFQRFTGMSRHAESLPAAALFAAKVATTLREDCGPCTQLVTTMAERAGVVPDVLRAVLEGDTTRMGADAELGYRFAQATLSHDPEADGLREQVIARWGRKAVVTLGLGIASSRVYPTLKYAMGYGKTCVGVRVGGVEARPRVPESMAAAA
jgi:hypothetical protein